MSLICGIWQQAGAPPRGVPEMLQALPRPPGAVDGAWTDGSLAVAWRRRAAPAGEGTAPFVHTDPDRGLVVAGAIRLDGRVELCRRLRASPDRPDGELVLRAYARWGVDCPGRLLGDFAFLVRDSRRRVLFCARDHIGARPLYYSLDPTRLVFASSIAAVLAAPGVSDDIDEAALGRWCRLKGISAGEETLRRAVRRLPAGHALEVGADRSRRWRWWRPEEVRPAAPATADEHADAFIALYREVISDCLRGAGQAGVHLSGGLDSSSIAALSDRALQRQGRPAPIAFSWHPPPPTKRPRTEAETAEYRLMESVAAQRGLRLFYCPPTEQDVLAFLRADPSLGEQSWDVVHENVVLRCAAERDVDVLLSGWGGDEGVSFNGRGHHARLFREGRWRRLWREAAERSRHPLAHIALRVAPPAMLAVPPYVWHALRAGRLSGRPQCFLQRAYRPRTEPSGRPGWWWPGVREIQLGLLRQGHLAERIEAWSEAGARFGVEHRYPLLDRRMLEFALGLPPDRFRRGAWSRWLMRHALRGVLPPEVCWHRSKDDPVRYEAWRKASLAALAAVRRELEARPAPPSRAVYLHMPRLMAHLDDRGLRPGVQLPLLKALAFLDWGTPGAVEPVDGRKPAEEAPAGSVQG